MRLAGVFGVDPLVLGRLDAEELVAWVRGARHAERTRWRRTFVLVSTMVNIHTGSRTSVEELMGEAPPSDGFFDAEIAIDDAREMREAKESAEAEGWDEGLLVDDEEMARLEELLVGGA